MQCPNCQTDVEEWHFYCPQCRTQVSNYNSEPFGRQGLVGKSGSVIINILILLFLVGGSVVVAKAIKWNDLINLFKDPVESIPTIKSTRPKKPAESNQRSKP